MISEFGPQLVSAAAILLTDSSRLASSLKAGRTALISSGVPCTTDCDDGRPPGVRPTSGSGGDDCRARIATGDQSDRKQQKRGDRPEWRARAGGVRVRNYR